MLFSRTPQTYRFVIIDAPVFPAQLSARFTEELGKPTHKQQAVQHALDLIVSERSRIAIYDSNNTHIATLGSRNSAR